MALYYGAKVLVTTADGEADPFNLSAGVLQGDTPSTIPVCTGGRLRFEMSHT